jgi:hypothetical protein
MLFAGKLIELEVLMSSEIKQGQKDKYHMIHSYMETRPKKRKKNDMRGLWVFLG